jgi:hypothetical protein
LRKLENSRVGLKQLSAKARIDPFATPSGNDRYLRIAAIDHRHDLRRAVRTERLLERKSNSAILFADIRDCSTPAFPYNFRTEKYLEQDIRITI